MNTTELYSHLANKFNAHSSMHMELVSLRKDTIRISFRGHDTAPAERALEVTNLLLELQLVGRYEISFRCRQSESPSVTYELPHQTVRSYLNDTISKQECYDRLDIGSEPHTEIPSLVQPP